MQDYKAQTVPFLRYTGITSAHVVLYILEYVYNRCRAFWQDDSTGPILVGRIHQDVLVLFSFPSY